MLSFLIGSALVLVGILSIILIIGAPIAFLYGFFSAFKKEFF